MPKRVVSWFSEAADRHRILTIVVVAVLIASPGYWRQEAAITKAQEAVDAIEAQTDVARKIACDQQNVVYGKINGILLTSVQPRPGQNRTADEQAAIDARIKPYLIPERNCTPEGIADYYKEPG